MSAGTLATWIAAAFAVAGAVAAWIGRGEVARRSVAMCLTFSAVATTWLLRALWDADHRMTFVARHVLLADDPLPRLLAIFAEPAGAGLVGCVAVAFAGWWSSREDPGARIAGTASVVALVLLAAPLTGRPLDLLPYQPADGAATWPFFAHPAALVTVLALVVQVVLATLACALALAQLNGGPPRSLVPTQLGVLIAAGVQALAWMVASIVTGGSDDLAPLTSRGGIWLAVVLGSALALRVHAHGAASALGRAEASLAALLLAIGCVLGTGGGAQPAPPAQALVSFALVVLTSAVWRGFPGDPRRWTGRVARMGVTVVLTCTVVLLWYPEVPSAGTLRFVRSLGMVTVFSWSLLPWRRAVGAAGLLALAGGLLLPLGRGTPFVPFLVGSVSALVGVVLAWRSGQVVRAWMVASLAFASVAAGIGSLQRVIVATPAAGGYLTTGGARLAHQGVSSYVEGNATVLALTLERVPGGTVARAEQREYVDARGAVLRPVWRRPALLVSAAWIHAAWLDRVGTDDEVTVRVAAVSGAWGWVLALLCLAAAIAPAGMRRAAN
ncbi:MAG: hypothetical protein IPK85_26345 [Gemmatimonadetes bacterium]|nr:hypothetical protein [Gemmatimonadota bacterium]